MAFQTQIQWTNAGVQARSNYATNHQIPVPEQYQYNAALNNAIMAWAFQQFAQYPGNPANQQYPGTATVIYTNRQGAQRNYPTNWRCIVSGYNAGIGMTLQITNVL